MIPWRFLVTILIIILLATFVGMNFDNSAEIRFWFGEKGEVTLNVVLALFGAFLVGVAITLPYVFRKRIHYVDMSKEKLKKEKAAKKAGKSADSQTLYNATHTAPKVGGGKSWTRKKAAPQPTVTPSPMEFQSLNKGNKGE